MLAGCSQLYLVMLLILNNTDSKSWPLRFAYSYETSVLWQAAYLLEETMVCNAWRADSSENQFRQWCCLSIQLQGWSRVLNFWASFQTDLAPNSQCESQLGGGRKCNSTEGSERVTLLTWLLNTLGWQAIASPSGKCWSTTTSSVHFGLGLPHFPRSPLDNACI